MGLDVRFATLDGISYGLAPVIRDVMAKAGLVWPSKEPEEFFDNSDRAYEIRWFGNHCREQDLPLPHARRLTCSCWQAIIPVDFPDPLPMFADKQPHDYADLWIPPSYGKTRSLNIENRWRYHRDTPASEVHLLSAQRLMHEVESWLALHQLRMPPMLERFQWHSLELPEDFHSEAYLHYCCDVAIRRNEAIYFDG